MAFIHTNFLTGNDSTGDGSTGTPYKTVYKAVQVAVSADFIKVAGGQWSSNLAGTFTFTQGSNVVNTSVSQVGTVLVDDILSFEDNQFGFDHFHIKVMSLTTTTITTAMFWPMATTTVSDVRRIQTYHYSSATATALETWSTTDVQPTGRTGITISGGWSNDFTTQTGWTVVRCTGRNISTANTGVGFAFTATGGGLGQWGTDLIWDRFMAHTASLWSPAASSDGCSFAFKELALVKGVTNAVQTRPIGMWQADPLVPSVIYSSTPGSTVSMNGLNYNIAINSDRPDVFECDIWATVSSNVSGTPNSGAIPAFGMATSESREGSINQINLKLRQDTIPLYSTDFPFYPTTSQLVGSSAAYIKSLLYYCNTPGTFYTTMGTFTTQIEDIGLTGPYASQSGVYLSTSSGQFIVDLSQEGITYDSLPAMCLYYYNVSFELPLNVLCQTNLQTVQLKDLDGLKTVDSRGNIYFKTGGNLKLNSGYSGSTNSSTLHAYKLIGVLNKPTTPFTVSFTLKVDVGAEASWDTLAVQYGPNFDQKIEQALTPTDAFATYTMTVDPADYSDWTKFAFPVYFGIRSKTANLYISEVQNYCYIQSITIV
jgi:hypothetical protein